MSELKHEVFNYLNFKQIQNEFSGSVLIAQRDHILFNAGIGLANREHEIRCTPKTKYRIGSITKQFTSMAILMLVEQGLLRVEDTLSNFIPQFPLGNLITIHHLLTHTSGIPNITQLPNFRELMKQHTPLEVSTRLLMNCPLDFKPGTQFKYTNSGYLLLALLIEKLTEQTYDKFLKDHIFSPLDMHDTGSDHYKEVLLHRASGYEFSDSMGIINSEFIDMSIATGGGNLYSTTEDLFKWSQMLSTDRLVSSKGLELIFTDYGFGYGYGWFIKKDSILNNSVSLVYHGGGIVGFKNEISRYVDDEVCIIVLNNLSLTQIDRISNELATIVFKDIPTS